MIRYIFFAAALVFSARAQAQDFGVYWKYKDYPGSLAFTVPTPVIDIASMFVSEKIDRKLFRRINKVRIMIFEHQPSPVNPRDMARFERKARRRHLEDLLSVRHSKTHFRVMVKDKRAVVRKLVVLVNEPDNFVLLTVKGRFGVRDLNTIIRKYWNDIKRKDEKPVLPESLKIPIKKM